MSDGTQEPTDDTERKDEVTEAEMREAVSRILKSNLFSSAPRIRAFLEYVASETIAGNSDRLRAKSIAYFVYDRDPVDELSSANVVRVEARRLRRLLEDYYGDEGRDDPVRVYIDKGGYAPRFERQWRTEGPSFASQTDTIDPDTEPSRSPLTARKGLFGAFFLFGLVVLAVVYVQRADLEQSGDSAPGILEREALMERSPAALEAANLTSQARGLIFPIFDVKRQQLTTELFLSAIEVDPLSAAAHAGAAQTLASQALLHIEGPKHDALLVDANGMLDRALELDPSLPWTQSAAGWVAFVSGDYDNAMRYSERAAALAPNDGNVLDFYGVVAVMSGEWETAISAATQERQRDGKNDRYGDQNILAAARFHTGDFQSAATIIEENNFTGGPLSAPVVIYLAATYHALGRDDDGRRMLALLDEDWPGFPAELVLKRLHRNNENAMAVVDRLRGLGWRG